MSSVFYRVRHSECFFQIGDLTGSTSWKNSGQEDQAKGQAEHKAAQAKGYGEGTLDRLAGAKDSIVGAITGDKTQQATGAFSFQFLFVENNCLYRLRRQRSE